MIDVFWYYLSTLSFSCVIGALLCVYRYFLGNRLTAQASKLKSQMANIRQNFPELEEKKNTMVANALGDIGIEGIAEMLGIDPHIITAAMKNPFVKGLIDRYAPKILEQISKQGGKSGSGEQETSLL
jgi:hypothetical protein